MTPRPVRLQRRRSKGFNMQAVSRAANGLPGRPVTRPGDFGNPFAKGGYYCVGEKGGAFRWRCALGDFGKGDDRFTLIDTNAQAVDMCRLMNERHGPPPRLRELIGQNLFCFCKVCDRHAITGKPLDEPCADCAPCHIDDLGPRVLALICEAVG